MASPSSPSRCLSTTMVLSAGAAVFLGSAPTEPLSKAVPSAQKSWPSQESYVQ